ncbi:MAG TPA: carboxypeptidase regulatory-like domain-containing protein [Candidatus Sulfotelmatobacter sp.]|nr:carboxypeptidase regulatory-like domain-containing protein [Candidatus Sulfotelmatobacter sp.]
MKKGVRISVSFGFVLTLIGLLALCAVGAFGQAIDGSVVGTVLDSSGAAIVGADVTATNVATNVSTTNKSGASGDYRFDHLPVGTYRISVKMTGFKSAVEQVVVELNKTSTRNLSLQPGTTSETVEVSGTPPAIDTTTSQLSTTYEDKLLKDLPSATVGSGVLNAALLQAGVASSGGLGAGSGPSVGGQRPRENNFTIEGTDNNDKGVTGPLVYVPNDAVANFTVIQNQFSPEFGHSAGGQFNQVITSGTNTIHGGLYEYFRNRNLNAIDQKIANQGIFTNPRYDNNRFGGMVGGPIIKNKLFYFVNFEYNPIGLAASPSSAALAPTAAGWNQVLAIPGVSASNINGFMKFATAPAANGDTVTVNDYVTTPGTPIPHTIPIGVVPIVAPAFQNNRALVTSMDWDVSDKDQVRGRYIYNEIKTIDTSALLPVFYTPFLQPYHLVTLAEFHSFTPNIGNEFRVGFNRTGQNYTVPGGALGKFQNLDAFPNLTIDDLGSINVGPDPNAPQYAIENTYQLEDNFSWVYKNHNFKFGVDLRKQIDPQKFIQRSRGDYDWTTLDGFANDQMPGFGQRSFGSVGYSGDDKMYGWYVNDIWKVTRNLSLNLGVRYEYLSVPFGWTQQSLNTVANDPGLITFNTPQAPKKDFMPRIGFAYSPGNSGNTSIRGGFSMGYDVLYDNIGTLSRPPQIGSTINCPDTQGFCHTTGFLSHGGIPPQQSSGITTLSQADARANTSSYLPEHVQYPYAESWNLGIQHVFKNYTAEVRYVGSRGVHLDTQNILNLVTYVTPKNSLPTYLTAPSQATLNSLPLTLDGPGGLLDQSYNCATTCLFDLRYLNDGFQSPITGFMPWGASTYHGLQTQIQRTLTNGLQFMGAWTWSHEIDNSTADFYSTVITPRRPQDFRNLPAERGNGLLDHAHRFTFQLSYDVQWFAHDSNWFKKNILGNYQFIPVYTYETGQWGTVQSGTDANLNGDSAPDRAIYNPKGQKGVGSDVTPLTNSAGYTVAYQAVNPNARYIVASYGAYATSWRGDVQTPPINNFDISAAKHFTFGERYRVDFMAQAFNLFNHPQFVTGYVNDIASFGNTGSRNYLLPASPTFLNASQNFSSNPRTMQLALKFTF